MSSVGRLDCRKSGFATFSRKIRYVLRLYCPLIADNSTLTPRKVFSATHMSRQKTDHTAFASADAKLCEAFFDKLSARRFCQAPGGFHFIISFDPLLQLFNEPEDPEVFKREVLAVIDDVSIYAQRRRYIVFVTNSALERVISASKPREVGIFVNVLSALLV